MKWDLFDIIIALPLLWAIYRGWVKGFILQLATLVALVVGIWGAQELTNVLVPYLKAHHQVTSQYARVTVFAICLLVLFGMIYLLGWILTKFVKIVALGIPNRLAGVVFSLLKYALMLCFAVFYLDRLNNTFNFMEPTLPQGSFFYFPMLKVANWIYVHIGLADDTFVTICRINNIICHKFIPLCYNNCY